MLLRRIITHLRSQSWLALGLDLLVVVVGIFLGFQVDRWYEGQRDIAVERTYLERLRADIEAERGQFQEIVNRTERRLEQITLVERALVDPRVAATDPIAFVSAIEQITWASFPRSITAPTYNELQTSGRAVLLRSERIRKSLVEYYEAIEDARSLAWDEDDRAQFKLRTVGLVSGQDLSAIEDPGRVAFSVTPQEAVYIARQLAQRAEAVAWLPRLQKYQVLMRRQSSDLIAQAQRLLNDLTNALSR